MERTAGNAYPTGQGQRSTSPDLAVRVEAHHANHARLRLEVEIGDKGRPLHAQNEAGPGTCHAGIGRSRALQRHACRLPFCIYHAGWNRCRPTYSGKTDRPTFLIDEPYAATALGRGGGCAFALSLRDDACASCTQALRPQKHAVRGAIRTPRDLCRMGQCCVIPYPVCDTMPHGISW